MVFSPLCFHLSVSVSAEASLKVGKKLKKSHRQQLHADIQTHSG